MSDFPTYIAEPIRKATGELMQATAQLEGTEEGSDGAALEHMERAQEYLEGSVSSEFGTAQDETVYSFLEDEERLGLEDALEMMHRYEGIDMDHLGRSIVTDKVKRTTEYLSEVDHQARNNSNSV